MDYLKQKPFFSDYSSTYKGSKSMPNYVALETRKSQQFARSEQILTDAGQSRPLASRVGESILAMDG